MNVNPLVAISCLTYNHASYIEDAMNGFCLQQTDFPFVAVIIDDASTDGEQAVIKNYLNDNFDMQNARQWETEDASFIESCHKNNSNCWFAVVLLKYNFYKINKSRIPLILEWSTSKYVAMCEGDDYWTDPNKLQIQVDFLETHKEYVLCSHNFMRFFENEERFESDAFYDVWFGPNMTKCRQLEFSLETYFHGWWTQPLTCVFRRADYQNQMIKKGYSDFRDNVFFYFVLKSGKGMLLGDVMGVYRINNKGVYTSKNKIDNLRIEERNALMIYHIEKDKNALVRVRVSVLNQIKLLIGEKKYLDTARLLIDYFREVPITEFLRSIIKVFKKPNRIFGL